MSFDAVGFGALNLDKLYGVNRIACEDEESYIKSLTESCGGSAANTIVGLSRLGIKTSFIGKVALDREGKLLIEHFNGEGVDTGNVIREDGRSGVVNGFTDENGQRALYVDSGVNDLIGAEEIRTEYFEDLKVLHLTSFVGKSSDRSIKTQRNLLKRISGEVYVTLDPGMLYAERGMKFLEKFLWRTNAVLINRKELKLLVGKEGSERLSTEEKQEKIYKKENRDRSIEKIIETCEDESKVLLDCGVEVVVVKCGEMGAYVTDGRQSYFKDIFPVRCVDTTGAGDAFNAGFLYGLIEGETLEKSCLMGNFVASKCVEKVGATRGLPYNIF